MDLKIHLLLSEQMVNGSYVSVEDGIYMFSCVSVTDLETIDILFTLYFIFFNKTAIFSSVIFSKGDGIYNNEIPNLKDSLFCSAVLFMYIDNLCPVS